MAMTRGATGRPWKAKQVNIPIERPYSREPAPRNGFYDSKERKVDRKRDTHMGFL